jgi:hypothetical protein
MAAVMMSDVVVARETHDEAKGYTPTAGRVKCFVGHGQMVRVSLSCTACATGG